MQTTPQPVTKAVLPPYLTNNSWEEELNYKLWVTSGSRFRADKRCSARARWSQLAITLLTTYLIILGVLPLLPDPLGRVFSPAILSFTTTAISIALLAYTLLESGFNYALKAHQFHECGLRVGRLYAALRRAKEIVDQAAKVKELDRITENYHTVLDAYENHEQIDYLTFQTSKSDYFKLQFWDRWIIWTRYYMQTVLTYHILILLPPFLVFWLILKTHPH